MGKRWIGVVALLAAVAVVSAGCGSSRKADSTGQGNTSSTNASSASTSSFGSLPAPCGKGTAKGATDAGVTDSTITIGYGDDAGFASAPGLDHEMSDAVKALMKWCNDQGGINGRQVVGKYYDAKITEVNNALTQACADKPLMLVGEGWALDAGQEQARLGCKLPALPAFAVSPQFSNATLTYSAVPNPVDYQSVTEINWYAKSFPSKAKKIGAYYANFPADTDTLDKAHSAWPKVGAQFLPCQLEYPITGEADYKPAALKLKECGAEAVYWIGSAYPTFENFLEAASQLDYHPDYLLEANFYDAQLAKWNTSGFADHVYVRLQDVPFESAEKSPATKQYMDLVKANGGDISDLGIHAASAFLLFATAAKSCGSNLTRDCVLKFAENVHDWTGGGLSGKADVGKNIPTPCESVVTLKGTSWTQVDPKNPGELDCDQTNVQQVTGPVVDKVKLGPDRKVQPG